MKLLVDEDSQARRLLDALRHAGHEVLRVAELGCNGVPGTVRRALRLARDMAEHLQRLKAVDADFVRRIRALVGCVEVDLDDPLSADDE